MSKLEITNGTKTNGIVRTNKNENPDETLLGLIDKKIDHIKEIQHEEHSADKPINNINPSHTSLHSVTPNPQAKKPILGLKDLPKIKLIDRRNGA